MRNTPSVARANAKFDPIVAARCVKDMAWTSSHQGSCCSQTPQCLPGPLNSFRGTFWYFAMFKIKGGTTDVHSGACESCLCARVLSRHGCGKLGTLFSMFVGCCKCVGGRKTSQSNGGIEGWRGWYRSCTGLEHLGGLSAIKVTMSGHVLQELRWSRHM